VKRALCAAALACYTQAGATFFSGNELYGWLTSNRAAETISALHYIGGVADTLDQDIICMPLNVTLGQVRDIVQKHLRANAEQRHNPADVLIRTALEPLWPCERKPARGRQT
jgi:hypothetical protein